MPTLLLLDRKNAVGHLRTRCGIPIEAEDLARLAIEGGGPPFRICAGRRARALYDPHDLEEWAHEYLGPVITRVSEHPSTQRAA